MELELQLRHVRVGYITYTHRYIHTNIDQLGRIGQCDLVDGLRLAITACGAEPHGEPQSRNAAAAHLPVRRLGISQSSHLCGARNEVEFARDLGLVKIR